MKRIKSVGRLSIRWAQKILKFFSNSREPMMTPEISEIKHWLIFFISLLFACSQQKTDDITNPVQTLEYSSAHFEFHLTEFDRNSIVSIAQHLEDNYSRVTADLSARNLPIINVQFYSSQSALHQTLNFPNSPAWLVGAATARDQIHMMSPNAPNLNRAFEEMLTILVHEFTHCVSLHLAPQSANNPRWLWEGVALYEAGQFVHPNRLAYLVNGNPPTLAGLNANWQTNAQIYEVGYLLVEYIVETWGKPQLANLINVLGDIQAVLGISVAAFESGWYTFVRAKYL
jgi:hypothetical protein